MIPLARIVHLRNVSAWRRAPHRALQTGKGLKPSAALALAGVLGVARGEVTVVARLHLAARVGFRVAALLDPFRAHRLEPGADVDLHRRIGVRPGRIINAQRRILRDLSLKIPRRCLRNFAHRDLVSGRRDDLHLLRIRERLRHRAQKLGLLRRAPRGFLRGFRSRVQWLNHGEKSSIFHRIVTARGFSPCALTAVHQHSLRRHDPDQVHRVVGVRPTSQPIGLPVAPSRIGAARVRARRFVVVGCQALKNSCELN